jgi:hypothetical protein
MRLLEISSDPDLQAKDIKPRRCPSVQQANISRRVTAIYLRESTGGGGSKFVATVTHPVQNDASDISMVVGVVNPKDHFPTRAWYPPGL